jgi:predicted acylesterase/phospholipase RssA
MNDFMHWLAGMTPRGIRGRRPRLAALVAILLPVLAGCATPERADIVPRSQVGAAQFVGIDNARFVPGEQQALDAEFYAAAQKEVAHWKATGHRGPLPPAAYLAISGGADDGAFGAGLLVGWSRQGSRPAFKAVTGISTGALSAPFAFLGPEYDAQLREVYTALGPDAIFEKRPIWSAITDDAISDTAPLYQTISRYLNEQMIARIAEEYAKGRLLLIMTTNLDAAVPVIWNIGAIAASGDPQARELILNILLASSAMPAAFPPVMMDVTVDGQTRQEMHVDGGVIAQVFLYPPTTDVNRIATVAGVARKRDAYVIRNGRLGGDVAKVDRQTMTIAGRALSVMITSSGMNDMYRLYQVTKRDGVGYHLAYIPPAFDIPYSGPFDTVYMNKLFEFGYNQGLRGGAWEVTAPDWVNQ